jgi:hypothetical protein
MGILKWLGIGRSNDAAKAADSMSVGAGTQPFGQEAHPAHLAAVVMDHDAYPSSQLIARVISRHDYHASGSVVGHIAAGDDAMSQYIRLLRDPVADEFEARLVSWLGAEGIKLQFASGTNSGYWIIPASRKTGGTEFSIIGQRKNSATPPRAGTDWILRFREPPSGRFLGLLEPHFKPRSGLVKTKKVDFDPSRLTPMNEMVDGRRGQWKSLDLAPESVLARPLSELIDPVTLDWRG